MTDYHYSETRSIVSNLKLDDNSGKKNAISFFMGMAVIVAAILLGRSFLFYIPFLLFSVFITLVWRRNFRPWVNLVSTSAATPIAIAQQNFSCNLIFAIWYSFLNRQYYSSLPNWIKIASGLAVFGLFTSSINWMSIGIINGMMRQGSFFVTLFLGPYLLLPIVYMKMKESQDHTANLQGLLFCLIIPSTLVLVGARAFGTVANAWEASLHGAMLPEGFLMFRFGKVIVSFLRTDVGFILAVLTCASLAISISKVRTLYRLLSGACFVSNLILLFMTGSFGSGFSCLCGMLAIFSIQIKKLSVKKVLGSVVAMICVMFVVYNLLPQSTKTYLEKRYEHRVTKADTDRFDLWGRALDHFFKYPEGVGLNLSVAASINIYHKVRSNIHNEYLVYAVSYGLFGGIAFVLIVAKLLIYYLKMRKHKIDDPYALATYLAGLGVVIAVSLNCMTDHLNANRWYFNVSWSIIWYCYFCTQGVQTENTMKSA
ncbi:MAG TPA: O-antigen ligase family protein [Desulfatiglandales bacterium]|nr:O-antigen ligase family protein [Desulfatiglandales bacterium]